MNVRIGELVDCIDEEEKTIEIETCIPTTSNDLLAFSSVSLARFAIVVTGETYYHEFLIQSFKSTIFSRSV